MRPTSRTVVHLHYITYAHRYIYLNQYSCIKCEQTSMYGNLFSTDKRRDKRMSECLFVCVFVCVCVHLYVCYASACMCVYVCAHVRAYMCVRVCVSVCLCVCVWQRLTQAKTQINRQTSRRTDSEGDWQNLLRKEMRSDKFKETDLSVCSGIWSAGDEWRQTSAEEKCTESHLHRALPPPALSIFIWQRHCMQCLFLEEWFRNTTNIEQ